MPIHCAAKLANLEAVKLLLDAGSAVDPMGAIKLAREEAAMRTPLMDASLARDPAAANAVIDLLLENGADIFAANENSETVFTVCRRPEILARLFKKV